MIPPKLHSLILYKKDIIIYKYNVYQIKNHKYNNNNDKFHIKSHGLGNDYIVIDGKDLKYSISKINDKENMP